MILITGATGFIGQALVRRLKSHGYRVKALSRQRRAGPWDAFFVADLAKDEIPPEAVRDVDTVFHLAGVAHTTNIPAIYYEQVNVQGTRRLLHAAHQAGVQRFIYFSSIKAAAPPPPDRCVDETWDAWPADAYGHSKREAETLVRQSSIPHVVVLRPALVYGPGVKGNLQRLLKLIASGRCPPLPDTGNRRSYVHVEDVVTAAILSAEQPQAHRQIYILAEPRPLSTRAIYEGVLQALGKRAPRWAVPYRFFRWAGYAGDALQRLGARAVPWSSAHVERVFGSACYDATTARRELAWAPAHDLLSSLSEMLEPLLA